MRGLREVWYGDTYNPIWWGVQRRCESMILVWTICIGSMCIQQYLCFDLYMYATVFVYWRYIDMYNVYDSIWTYMYVTVYEYITMWQSVILNISYALYLIIYYTHYLSYGCDRKDVLSLRKKIWVFDTHWGLDFVTFCSKAEFFFMFNDSFWVHESHRPVLFKLCAAAH